MRTPMIAITTKSSTSVKPRFLTVMETNMENFSRIIHARKMKYDGLGEVVGILVKWHDGEAGVSPVVYFSNDVTYFH